MKIDKNPAKIQKIFDEIATYYDEMNNWLSLGFHFFIKKTVLRRLKLAKNSVVLDICCGTGDFTKIISSIAPSARVIGLDNSINMIKLAKAKNPKNTFIKGDCTDLPFKDSEFDAITAGFGLRNVENRQKALSEVYRTLKTGGKFLHLDFGKHNFVSKMFDIAVPFLVKLKRKDTQSYKYLINSKNDYPEPQELIREFQQCGFKLLESKEFMFGAIACQIVEK